MFWCGTQTLSTKSLCTRSSSQGKFSIFLGKTIGNWQPLAGTKFTSGRSTLWNCQSKCGKAIKIALKAWSGTKKVTSWLRKPPTNLKFWFGLQSQNSTFWVSTSKTAQSETLSGATLTWTQRMQTKPALVLSLPWAWTKLFGFMTSLATRQSVWWRSDTRRTFAVCLWVLTTSCWQLVARTKTSIFGH